MLTAAVTAGLIALAFIVYQHSAAPLDGLGPRLTRAVEYGKATVAAMVVVGVLIAPLVVGGHAAPAAPPAPAPTARPGGAR